MKGFEQFRGPHLFPDLCLINDGRAAEAVSLLGQEGGRLYSPEHTAVIIDQTVPPNSPEISKLQRGLAALARRERTAWYYGRGMAGHLLMEEGLVKPGQVAVGCSEDLSVIGAAGALGIVLKPDRLAEALGTGR